MYAARLGNIEDCLANHMDVQGEPQEMFPDEDEEEDSGTWLSDPPPGKLTLLFLVSHTAYVLVCSRLSVFPHTCNPDMTHHPQHVWAVESTPLMARHQYLQPHHARCIAGNLGIKLLP